MRRTLTLLLLAVAALLGVAGPASATTSPTLPVTTWQSAVAEGWERPTATPGSQDLAGRYDTHPLAGTDYGSDEDQPGWDCRLQGNQACGSVSQHLAIRDCVIFGQFLQWLELPGDPHLDYVVECFGATYSAPLDDAHPRMGEWHAEWTAWYDRHASLDYTYDRGAWY